MTGIFLSGCIEGRVPPEKEKFFFDLKGFFEKEASLLNEQKITAEKYLISEKDTQKLILSSLNWEKEFAPFINSDINKPAWKGSYNVDSVLKDQKIQSVIYTSLEKNLPVKQIQIHFNNDNVSNVYIENATKNYVYNSGQILSYYAKKGFAIEGEQDIVLGKDLHYRVIVNFIE